MYGEEEETMNEQNSHLCMLEPINKTKIIWEEIAQSLSKIILNATF